MSNCTADQLQDIHTYHSYQQNRIRELMQQKPNSAIWSPSCPFHCNFERGNTFNAQLMQVPIRSGFTLEVAMKMFITGTKDDTFNWIWLDNLLWPQNTPCSFYGLGDDIVPSTATSNKCW